MKLRNKKTGKVFDAIVREKRNGDGEYSIIVCNLRAIRSARSASSLLGEYDSLESFNKEWEDYKPTEPLIKDEKIHKAKVKIEVVAVNLAEIGLGGICARLRAIANELGDIESALDLQFTEMVVKEEEC